MGDMSRYAIYYAPEVGSELARFGASWLGWDAQTGQHVKHPAYKKLPVPVSELTKTPRKYGFHGTLKPPFRLTYGKSITDLNDALTELSSKHSAFEVKSMSVRALGGFIAITPDDYEANFARLANACVTDLDAFRAPLTPEDLARRRATALSEKQEEYLAQWGYPYVFDEFRFHMTLTGKITPNLLGPCLSELKCALSKPLSRPLQVHEICLFREDEDGFFHIFKRYPLNAWAARQPETQRKTFLSGHRSR
jgi:putative phosphonate metabolism protein